MSDPTRPTPAQPGVVAPAARMRSVQPTVVDVIVADQEAVGALFDRAEALQGWPRRGVVEELIDAISVHLAAKHEALYDVLDERCADAGIARRAHAHRDVCMRLLQALYAMQGPADAPRIDVLLTRLRRVLQWRFAVEATHVFPRALDVVDGDELERLADVFLAAAARWRRRPLLVRMNEGR